MPFVFISFLFVGSLTVSTRYGANMQQKPEKLT